VVAVETVLWFPRSGGRVLCVHGSGSFHRLIEDNHESGSLRREHQGSLAHGSARRGSVSRRRGRGARPVGNCATERQYRADDAQRLTVWMKEAGWITSCGM